MSGWAMMICIVVCCAVGGLYALVLSLIKKLKQKKNVDNLPPATEQKKYNPTNTIALVLIAVVSFLITMQIVNQPLKGTKEKVFSKAGMEITLTEDFYEKDMAAYTAYYESKTSIVLSIKEEFTIFENAGISTDISLREYAEMVLTNNVKNNIEVTEKDGLTFFEFDKTANGKDFTYFAVVFRGDDAYWLFQFACETKNYDKLSKDFIAYAKSVKL